MDKLEAIQEIEALIKYLVNHNLSHTKELEDLAVNLKEAGMDDAYACVLRAIKHYQEGNEELAASLEKFGK